MTSLMKSGLAAVLMTAGWKVAAGQATLTGPSTWTAGQPITVTWKGTSTPFCASGVRAALVMNGNLIQMGSPVAISAGTVTVPAVTLAPGSTAVVVLADLCVPKKLDSNTITVRITGAPVTPVTLTPTASTISAQVRQSIDTACQGVLGAACSTTSSYGSTYTAITQQISAGKLASDSGSIMNNYLIPMVRSSTGWQSALIASAWSATRCAGPAPTAQWLPQYGTWTTYQQLYNQMAAKGCAAASGNTQQIAAVQYLTAAQLTPAYLNVWGPAYKATPMMTNCPVANGADACARSALAQYVKANGSSILQTVATYAYTSAVGSPLDSTRATILAQNFGRTWTGADDVTKYIQANPSLFPTSTVFAGLDAQGYFVNAAGKKLSPNEAGGNYFLDSKGAHAPGVYPATLKGAMVILSAANPGGGVLVSNSGVPLKVLQTGSQWAIGNGIVAQGGGNIVAQGGGNIVAQGGGNIVAQGGGNIVAQGGGNIILQGCCNVGFTDAASAARTAGLLDARGASVISNDGGSFLPTMMQVPAIASLLGKQAAGVINTNGSNLLTDNGAALQRSTLSVSGMKPAVMKGPSTWTYGQQGVITWTASPGATACNKGYVVLINGNQTVGYPVALSLGKSVVPAGSWPKGTVLSVSLESACDGTVAAAPISTRYQ